MKIKFISLASGSSGNCYFLGTDRYGILVDAGIGIRTIKKTLKELGIGLDIIRAVFITHDHADHIKAVGHLGEKFGIPIYSTPEVHAGINKSYCMTEKLSTCVHLSLIHIEMCIRDSHYSGQYYFGRTGHVSEPSSCAGYHEIISMCRHSTGLHGVPPPIQLSLF